MLDICYILLKSQSLFNFTGNADRKNSNENLCHHTKDVANNNTSDLKEKNELADGPGKCSNRSPSCPDSTTSPSFVSNDRNVDHKVSLNSPSITALETKGSESETSLDINPSTLNWRKTEDQNINPFCDTNYAAEKAKVPCFPSINSIQPVTENNIYPVATSTHGHLLDGGLASMAMHTSPVALHLLSSYIAAGFVPQIPFSHSAFAARPGFTPLNSTPRLQNSTGINFHGIESLMNKSSSYGNLRSESISKGSLDKDISSNSHALTTSINPGIVLPSNNGSTISSDTNIQYPTEMAVGAGDVHLASHSSSSTTDIKRPIPHLPHNSSGVGML